MKLKSESEVAQSYQNKTEAWLTLKHMHFPLYLFCSILEAYSERITPQFIGRKIGPASVAHVCMLSFSAVSASL